MLFRDASLLPVLRHGWDVYVYNNRTIVVKNLARSVPNLFFVFVSLTKE